MKQQTIFQRFLFSFGLLSMVTLHGACTVRSVADWLRHANGITVMPVRQQQEVGFQKMGDHLIAEFMGCKNLNAADELEALLRSVADVAGAAVQALLTQGMSGIVLLQNSHISVHTWPERGYVAIDIFIGDKSIVAEKMLALLQDFFKPTKVRVIKVDRGVDDSL